MASARLTDLPGLRAAHWTHSSGTTGCTALAFPAGAVAGVAVPGHAPGSRELGTLSPTHLADRIHGLVLSGGSAFGLATADGAMACLAEAGIGLPVGAHTVPIVPAAILFDLPVAAMRPGAAEGRSAMTAALQGAPLGSGAVGAGAGARVGKAWDNPQPGGFGQAGAALPSGRVVAGVAVNAFGGVRDPHGGGWVAGGPSGDAGLREEDAFGQNTTLAVVATDAALTRPQCAVLAQMATAGLARALDPVFTPFDGDTVFAVSTGQGEALGPAALLALGRAAAVALAEAVLDAVRPR